jgi:uncharacterized protein involved in outer membrane biogenesis
MTRRRKIVLSTLLALGVAAVLVVRHYAQPAQVSRVLVTLAHERLGLALTFTGEPRYSFFPRLALELDAPRLRAASEPVLAARRLGVTLPWRSLYTSELRIERIELDAPVLDLDRLAEWTMPAASADGPRDTTAHVVIADGRIVRDGKAIMNGVTVDAELALNALRTWVGGIGARAVDSVLPPLGLEATIDTIDLGGTTLEGVRIDVDPPAAAP